MTMSIRDAVMYSYEIGKMGYSKPTKYLFKLRLAFDCIGYTCTLNRGPKGCKKMDIQALVEKWIPVVVQLATAHDKDEFDQAEAQIDDLLTPILTAPIKQVREFYVELLKAMKADCQVPMLVWIGFEAWGKVMVENAPDQAVKRLKVGLATEIAELVEEDVKPQISKAISRALQWRDPEVLEKVRDSVKAGNKPKLVGRESCLFLEIGKGKDKATVML